MIKAAIIAALLQSNLCVNASPIKAGQPAPCSGILFSADQARKAVECKRVEIPKLKTEMRFNAEQWAAREQTYQARLLYLESAINAENVERSWWVVPLVGVAFLGIGYAVGNLTGGAR